MTPDALRLRIDGPLVVATLADPDGPFPPARLRLIVDTGADTTVISRHLVDNLGMARTRTEWLRGATGAAVRASMYRVHLVLEEVGATFDVEVFALPREDDADGLLGRDVLAHLHLSYLGPQGTFTLAQPPVP